ncbi:hypothetical protein [Hydrogenophaga sp. BPS33]|uniref:hypothetical protein n=1 Tax=Hydrogenophaga sp. BPS33 TaxID=2651974 RepID=UPI00132037E4|nr:hypothetical protein [Hydrogenophaga sp. BPS33]QHE86072.1 hypothetical protein F9K07_14760 [Hydrogenophaga sp. BPS33]
MQAGTQRITKDKHLGREAFAEIDKHGTTAVFVREVPHPRRSGFAAVREAISNLKARVIYRMNAEQARRKLDDAALLASSRALSAANEALRQQLHINDADASQRPPKRHPDGTPIVLTPKEENKELQATNFVLRQMVQADGQLVDALNIAVHDRDTNGAALAERVDALYETLKLLDADRKIEAQIAGLYLRRVQGYVSSKKMDVQKLGYLVAAADVCRGGNELNEGGKAVLDNIVFCARAELLRRDAVSGLDKVDRQKLKVISDDANTLLEMTNQRWSHLTSTDVIPGTKLTLSNLGQLINDAADRQAAFRAADIILKVAGKQNPKNLSDRERKDLEAAFDLCKKRPKLFNQTQTQALKNFHESLHPKPKATVLSMPLRPVENVMTIMTPATHQKTKANPQNPVRQPAPSTTVQVSSTKVDKATLLRAEQKKVQNEFQKLLSEAMGYMWDPSPDFDDSLDEFNRAAAVCLVDAARMFQKAMAQPRLQLTDYEQSKWIRESVKKMSPTVLEEIETRLDDGLLGDLFSWMRSMNSVPMDMEDFVGHWAHEVRNAGAESD